MKWRHDWGLRLRMIGVLTALSLLYVVFAAAISLYFEQVFFVILAGVGLLGVAQLWWGHRFVLRSIGGSIVSEQTRPQLHTRVSRLAYQAGIPKPNVAVADTSMPNAFATGRSQNTAVICVTTGLLDTLDDEELDAVLAHELAHVQHRDMVIMTIASLLSALAFYVVRWGFIYDSDKSEQYTWMAVVASLGVWITSLFITRLLSRYREFAADRGAVAITGNPIALASALRSIDGQMDEIPSTDLREHAGVNALFVRSVPQNFSVWHWNFDMTKWLQTHPAVDQRIDRLQTLTDELSP